MCSEALWKYTESVVGRPKYVKGAFRERWPGEGDCLTAVFNVFNEVLGIEIPVTWIGDVPRKLVEEREWKILDTTVDMLKVGDLIFTKIRAGPRMVSHVGIFLGEKGVFHCSYSDRTAVIVPLNEFLERYPPLLNAEEVLAFVDPRNTELRSKSAGPFLSPAARKDLSPSPSLLPSLLRRCVSPCGRDEPIPATRSFPDLRALQSPIPWATPPRVFRKLKDVIEESDEEAS